MVDTPQVPKEIRTEALAVASGVIPAYQKTVNDLKNYKRNLYSVHHEDIKDNIIQEIEKWRKDRPNDNKDGWMDKYIETAKNTKPGEVFQVGNFGNKGDIYKYATEDEKKKYDALQEAQNRAYEPVSEAVTTVLKKHGYNPDRQDMGNNSLDNAKENSDKTQKMKADDFKDKEGRREKANEMRNVILRDIASPPNAMPEKTMGPGQTPKGAQPQKTIGRAPGQ